MTFFKTFSHNIVYHFGFTTIFGLPQNNCNQIWYKYCKMNLQRKYNRNILSTMSSLKKNVTFKQEWTLVMNLNVILNKYNQHTDSLGCNPKYNTTFTFYFYWMTILTCIPQRFLKHDIFQETLTHIILYTPWCCLHVHQHVT